MTTKLIRQFTGWTPADGEPQAPIAGGRDVLYRDLVDDEPDTTVYPRLDIAQIPEHMVRVYAPHLRDYETEGAVWANKGQSLSKKFGSAVVKNHSIKIPREGLSMRTEDALFLLQHYSLLLTTEAPPEPIIEEPAVEPEKGKKR